MSSILGVVTFDVRAAPHDGVIQITQVMIHCSAPRNATRQSNAVLMKIFDIHLSVGVLVEANDNCRPILPQVEEWLIERQLLQGILIERHVEVDVGAVVTDVSHVDALFVGSSAL